MAVIKTIHQCRKIGGCLGGKQARLPIGEVQQLQTPGNREVNDRHHIVALTGGDHAAGRIGGCGEKSNPLDALCSGKHQRRHSNGVVGITDVKDRSNTGRGTFQTDEGIGFAIDRDHLNHFRLSSLVVITVIGSIEISQGIGKVIQGLAGIKHHIAFIVKDS